MKTIFFLLVGMNSFFCYSQNFSTYQLEPQKIESRKSNTVGAYNNIIDVSSQNLINTRINTLNVISRLQNTNQGFSGDSRGVRNAALFKSIAPSVVLIVTKDGIGTGTLINNNSEILTNWHVVGSNKIVSVIFKPEKDTQKVSDSEVVQGTVVKLDQQADLALVKVAKIPQGRKPVRLGNDSDIQIGLDVHAIGHPRGESWTYTKGVISQYRNDYEWTGGNSSGKHKANVIQTQTPINPGNSGGPLVLDNGLIIGVNSFKNTDTEGINFAVSVEDVRNFLNRKENRLFPPSYAKSKAETNCEWKVVFQGKSSDGKSEVTTYDTKCDGNVNVELHAPYEKTEPIYMNFDRNLDKRTDFILFSFKRDMKWDLSFWDDNFDGQWDRVGYHEDGNSKPSRYEDFSSFSAKAKK
jgi:S1-C subfamily serine protease